MPLWGHSTGLLPPLGGETLRAYTLTVTVGLSWAAEGPALWPRTHWAGADLPVSLWSPSLQQPERPGAFRQAP